MDVIQAVAKVIFNRLGYDVRRFPGPNSHAIAARDADPVTFDYLPSRRGYGIFEVDLNDVRSFNPICLPLKAGQHPFVTAFKILMKSHNADEPLTLVSDVLRQYYDAVRPRDALTVLDISRLDAPGFCGVEAPFYALPWSEKTVEEIRLVRQRTAVFEGLQRGMTADVVDGLTNFGPATEAKIALETRRLSRLHRSFSQRGFVAFGEGGPVQVMALRNGSEYRWSICSGQHRFALAAAASMASVPAQVVQIIRREDASFWPLVKSGAYTERGALAVFDRIYGGRPAHVANGWLNRSDN